jgi:flagellar export protein FliJ
MKVLARLVRYHRHLLDEKRRALRELEERSDSIENAIGGLETAIADERASAARSMETNGAYGGFVRASLDRRTALLGDLEAANADVESARDELVDMFAEAKRFEISLENQRRSERRALERREQEGLDEASLNMHRREKGSRP